MKRLRSESGYTLMELILIIMVLSIALLPLITQLVQTTVHSGDGQLTTAATFLARERMEQIAGDNGAPAIDYAGITASRYPDESTLLDFPGYSRIVRISPDSTYSGTTYKVVSVTVTPPTGPAVKLVGWVVQ